MAREPSSTGRSATTRRAVPQVAILLAALVLTACDRAPAPPGAPAEPPPTTEGSGAAGADEGSEPAVDDPVWDAWRHAHDRVHLVAVDVPNIFSRAEVDAFLAADDGDIERWYLEHANHFLRPPDPADPSGTRTMRPLDETLRREIAQRMLREVAVASSSAARADAVRAVLAQHAEGAEGALGSGLRAVDTGFFVRAADGNVPYLGQMPELLDAVFAEGVAVGDVIGPVRTTSGLIVARVEARELPDRAAFESEMARRESGGGSGEGSGAVAPVASGSGGQPRNTDTGRTQ